MKMKLLLLVLGVFAIQACSNKPALKPDEVAPYNEAEELIKSANLSIKAAEKSEVITYAPNSILSAKSHVKLAEAAIKLKDFSKAKEEASKALEDISTAQALPLEAENAIKEAETQLNAAKEAKADEDSPEAYKSAAEDLDTAKLWFNKKYYNDAIEFSKKSVEKSKASTAESADFKNLIQKSEELLKMAKDIKLDELAPEAFKNINESFEAAKTASTNKETAKAKENAEKTISTAMEEIKKAVQLNMEQAKSELSSAKDAGAEEFAKEQLDSAEEEMKNASEAFDKEDYVVAKSSSEKVIAKSKEASEKAKLGKEMKAMLSKETVQAEKPAEAVSPTTETTAQSENTETQAEAVNDTPIAAQTETKEPEEVKTPVVEKPLVTEKIETPAVTKKDEIAKKADTTAANNADAKKPDTKAAGVAANKDIKKSSFPIVPIAAGVGILAAILLGIRFFRKRVTSEELLEEGSSENIIDISSGNEVR
jgi:tetratricopeptide (TPR) repeat protein